MNNGLSALSAAIGAVNLSNGDDPIALIQALQDARADQMAKAANEARKTLLADIGRLQNILATNLPARLQALPDAPDGQGKIVCEIPSDQVGETLPDEIAALGLQLRTETWLRVTSGTYDAGGNITEQPATLASPDSLAAIRATGDRTQMGSVDRYSFTTAGGQTMYFDIHNDQGEVRTTTTDIAMFDLDLVFAIRGLQEDVESDIARLDGFAERLSEKMKGDKPLMDQARHNEEVHQANHLENIQQANR